MADNRMTKLDAEYVEHPMLTKQHCADCAMYAPPGRCATVEGPIAAMGWCRMWEARRDRR